MNAFNADLLLNQYSKIFSPYFLNFFRNLLIKYIYSYFNLGRIIKILPIYYISNGKFLLKERHSAYVSNYLIYVINGDFAIQYIKH
jgi:hypothetical protein